MLPLVKSYHQKTAESFAEAYEVRLVSAIDSNPSEVLWSEDIREENDGRY